MLIVQLNKYVFHLAYSGTNYRGWQWQPNAYSVQQCLEEAFAQVLKEKINCLGCGRTDAEVHASQYFMQINCKAIVDEKTTAIINKVLPSDISIYSFFEVAPNFNVRYDATSRTYRYYFHTQKTPFLSHQSSYYQILDFNKNAVLEALQLIKAQQDFKAFCLNPDKHNTTLVNVAEVSLLHSKSFPIYSIQIKANRFLRGMIRALMYSIIKIGNNTLQVSDFKKVLQAVQAANNLQIAYPQGLYLAEVCYNNLEVDPIKEPVFGLLE